MRIRASARHPVWGCLLLSLVLPLNAFAKGPAKKLIIFGDSLSDSGNFFVETGECVKSPFEPIAEAPYEVGGHHFSNGRTWVEQLATRMRVPHNGHPASRAPGVFTNYAFGRSRARSGAPEFSAVDLSTQVNLFYADFGGSGPPDAVYVVWIGSNDVRDALAALSEDPSGAQSGAIIEAALTSIANNIITLYGAGARVFLVLNAPNIAITPAVRALGEQNPMIPMVAEQLSVAFNDGLLSALAGLDGLLSDVQILHLDAFSVLNEVIADPQSVGLSNVTDTCLQFGVVNHAVCKHPDQFLFWDAIHPTTAGHAVLAEAATQLMSAP